MSISKALPCVIAFKMMTADQRFEVALIGELHASATHKTCLRPRLLMSGQKTYRAMGRRHGDRRCHDDDAAGRNAHIDDVVGDKGKCRAIPCLHDCLPFALLYLQCRIIGWKWVDLDRR
jgi:hypothetical protein